MWHHKSNRKRPYIHSGLLTYLTQYDKYDDNIGFQSSRFTFVIHNARRFMSSEKRNKQTSSSCLSEQFTTKKHGILSSFTIAKPFTDHSAGVKMASIDHVTTTTNQQLGPPGSLLGQTLLIYGSGVSDVFYIFIHAR